MSDVVRLPVQHPRAPHCPDCGADIPSFDGCDLSLTVAALCNTSLLGVTFHVQCGCGKRVDVMRTVKRQPPPPRPVGRQPGP